MDIDQTLIGGYIVLVLILMSICGHYLIKKHCTGKRTRNAPKAPTTDEEMVANRKSKQRTKITATQDLAQPG